MSCCSARRRQQLFDADNVDDARQIVAEHAQRHLGRHLRQRRAEKMRRPHPHFQCAEGVLDRLAPRAHRIRIAIEPLLYLFKHVLVLPARYAPLLSCRAFGLERAAAAGIRPIAAEFLSILLLRIII